MKLIGVEAGGRSGRAWASMQRGSAGGAPGVLHGAFSYLLQDEDGQVSLTHSVSAGLDYASVGPEHAWLHDQRPRGILLGDRRRGDRSRQAAGADRRNHPGARIGARDCTKRFAARPTRKIRSLSSTSPAAATKTPTFIARTSRRLEPRRDAQSTMTRIAAFERLRTRERRPALIAYLTAGDPSPERTAGLVQLWNAAAPI